MRGTIAGLFALVLGTRWRKLDTVINSDSMPQGCLKKPELESQIAKTQFKENKIFLLLWHFADRTVKLNG